MPLTKEDTKVQKLVLNVGTEENIQAAISAGEIGENELSIITNKSDCKRNVGEIIESALPLTDAGLHLLDGSLILGGGIYDEFVQYIADLYTEDPTANYWTTEAAWQQSVTDYGVCEKFVYDSVNNTVRLPKISSAERYLIKSYHSGNNWYRVYSDGWCEQGGRVANNSTSTTVLLLKPYINTNYTITGSILNGTSSTTYEHFNINTITASSFIFATYDNYGLSWKTSGYIDISGYEIVQQYEYIVVAASIKTDVEVDIDNIATDLNGKADRDLSNMNPSASTKETIVGWGIPDYSAAIQVSSDTDYTAPCAGVLTSPTDIYINGTKRFEFFEVSGSNTANSMTAIVDKGDVCRSTTSTGFIYFYPYKGVNNA